MSKIYGEGARAVLSHLNAALSTRLFPTVYERLDSTSRLCKRLAAEGAPEGTLLLAETQTEGHGRFARPFFSPVGGLYMSLLLRPRLAPSAALDITTAAALAVAETAETLSGRAAGIKWVNDVYMDGRKVCGVLTEGGLTASGTLAYAVLGIGVNVIAPREGFPPPLDAVAGAVLPADAAETSVAIFAAELLTRFFGYYDALPLRKHAEGYCKRSLLTGRRVRVYSGAAVADKGGIGIPATVLCMSEDLCPVLRYDDGREEVLCSGEVSLLAVEESQPTSH